MPQYNVPKKDSDTEIQRWDLKIALKRILVSVITISGSFWILFYTYTQIISYRSHDPKYAISLIEQTSSQKEALKTVFLAELLNLSADRPQNYYHFDPKMAERHLNSLPIFKQVKVQKKYPNIAHINYEMRKPFAYLYDFANTMIDENGICFPVQPFFTPKLLPQIYLGAHKKKHANSSANPWGCKVPEIDLKRAADITLSFDKVKKNHSQLRFIDLSRIDHENFGKREIILQIEEINLSDKNLHPTPLLRTLRLHYETYEQGIANYFRFHQYCFHQENSLKENPFLKQGHLVIDLRIPKLAFFKHFEMPKDVLP